MFNIRRALPEDAGGIAVVHVQSWHETYPGIVPQNVIDALSVVEKTESWTKRLLENQPISGFTYVAEDNNQKIIGFASGGPTRKELFSGQAISPELIENFDGEMRAIYLLRAHQHVGVGKALFKAVCEELKRLGHKRMLVRVLLDNPSKGFYEHMGGVLVAENELTIGVPLKEAIFGWDQME